MQHRGKGAEREPVYEGEMEFLIINLVIGFSSEKVKQKETLLMALGSK